MALSRRAFLATQGAAAGTLLVPGRLLTALEAASPKPPPLDDWAKVRSQFRLSPEVLHFAGFFIASHPAPVREAIDSWRKAIKVVASTSPYANVYARLSAGIFNTPAEVDQALAALRTSLA